MLNIAETLYAWCREARPFALATVVDVSGSVSGGCVEGAVYELCRETLESGGAPVLTRFGYSDSDAFAVGLTCGGEIDILVQRVDPTVQPHLTAALAKMAAGRPAALAQIVNGPEELLGGTLYVPGDGPYDGTLSGRREDEAVAAQARALLRTGRTGRIEVGGDADTCPERLSVLVHTSARPPRMLIFGAVDFADALSEAGRFLGYRVTVCDARPVFATRARFPHADEIVADWPHQYLAATEVDARTALCVLTHDAKFDIPLLRLALSLPVGYIGAMGSRRTHKQRLELLRENGVPEADLARLNSPIGLDLGAHTPQETAVSITAEIIAHAHDGTGLPLSRRTGPIHAPMSASWKGALADPPKSSTPYAGPAVSGGWLPG